MPPKPDYNKRAELILTTIIKSGGEAGLRDIWLKLNGNGHEMTYSLIQDILKRMHGNGHVEMTGTPALWKDTRKGREWLKKRKRLFHDLSRMAVFKLPHLRLQLLVLLPQPLVGLGGFPEPVKGLLQLGGLLGRLDDRLLGAHQGGNVLARLGGGADRVDPGGRIVGVLTRGPVDHVLALAGGDGPAGTFLDLLEHLQVTEVSFEQPRSKILIWVLRVQVCCYNLGDAGLGDAVLPGDVPSRDVPPGGCYDLLIAQLDLSGLGSHHNRIPPQNF